MVAAVSLEQGARPALPKVRAARRRVGIIGATGYTGVELVRLLAQHPRVELAGLAAQKDAGKRFDAAWPAFAGIDLVIDAPAATQAWSARGLDTVFLALPHGEAAATVPALLAAGLRVIDLSADFRLRQAADYPRYYNLLHPAPELLAQAVYGLCEWAGPAIAQARLVASPGCYATAILLAALPAVAAGLWSGGPIMVNALSGVSGAGRAPKQSTHFVEAEASAAPYKVGEAHQHLGEIKQMIRATLGGRRAAFPIVFVPQVVPMARGILASLTLPLKQPLRETDAQALYAQRYADRPFAHVLSGEALPSTGAVRGSNRCDLAVRVVADGTQLLVLAALDNLVKGAAGQAIQSFNLMHGFDEGLGLPVIGWPV